MYIVYVGPFPFPWGQASSRRVFGVSLSIAQSGYSVIVASGGPESTKPVKLDQEEISGSLAYLGLGELPPSGGSNFNKFVQVFIFWGQKTVAWLDAQSVKPSHVIVYGGGAQYISRLLSWCKRHGIPLIVDIVEWYDPSHMFGGYFGPFHISAKIAMHYFYPKCSGIITISSFLEEYYFNKNCLTVRVPPTLDVVGIHFCHNYQGKDFSKLTLLYAGTPGKKDLLANVIWGINKIDNCHEKVRLLVVGPSLNKIKHLLNGVNPPNFVEILGHVQQIDIAKIIQQADFSVLLREPLRFAQAGFPTKFVESMANGTPVIANLTSDLGLYLRDGIEGLVCRDHTIDAFVETLLRALSLSSDERLEMRIAARKQAERSFDFRNYSKALAKFLDEVKR